MEQYVLMGTVVGAIILLALVLHYVPFVLWLSAKVSGVRISLLQLFLMRIRNVRENFFAATLSDAHT